MDDPSYFSFRMNKSQDDVSVIFVQPSSDFLQGIFECLKTFYNIDSDLHKELLIKANLCDEQLENLENKDPLLVRNSDQVEVKEEIESEIDATNSATIVKISSFVFFYNKCHLCNSQLSSNRELREHFHNIHEPQSIPRSDGRHGYLCRSCGKLFNQYRYAVKHCTIKDSHQSDSSVKQEQSNSEGYEKIVSNTDNTEKANDDPLEEKEVNIEIKEETENNQSLELKVQNQESVIKISCFVFYNQKCHLCTSQFKSGKDLRSHFYEKHEPLKSEGRNDYMCKTCGMHFDHYTYAVKHCKVYQCPDCKTTIKNKANIARHKKYCAGTELLFCSKCKSSMKSKGYFEKHILKCGRKKIHPRGKHTPSTEEEYISCHLCGYQTLYDRILKKHATIEHKDGNQKNFQCEKCERSFLSNKGLKNHNRLVHSL